MSKKEKKKVPQLRFPEFVEVLKLTYLDEILDFKNGINADKSQYGKGYKFINVLDIINDAPIYYESIIGSVEITEEEFLKNDVQYGDILFQRSSEIREEAGQSNIYLDKNQNATFGGFVIRGRPKVKFDPIYFNYLLKTQAIRKEITDRSGGSTRFNVGQNTLSEVPIFVSNSLAEQEKIASFLGAVDTRLNQLRRKREHLQTYKRGVMQKIFSQKIRFPQPDGSPFPAWERKKLGELGEVIAGLTYSPSDVEKEGLLVLRSSNVQDGKLAFDDCVFVNTVVNSKSLSRESDILICVRNGSTNLIGKNALIPKNIPPSTHGAFMVIFRSNRNSFIFQLFQTDMYKRQVYQDLGARINSINSDRLRKYRFLIPCIEEQEKIANFLTTLDRKIETLSRQIDQTEQFKKGLLQKMFV